MIKKFLILLLFCGISFNALAGFSLYPLSVDFKEEDRNRSQTLNIINSSANIQTYRVELVQLKQNPEGKFEQVKSTPNSAKELLTFSPRQFTLLPNKKQAIRIARKNLSNVEDGEYVSHLQVREVEMPHKKNKKSDDKEGFSVSIKVLQNVSLPVTIYKGKDLEEKTELVSAKEKNNAVEVVLKRLGNISSRLQLEVVDEEGKIIGKTDTVRIYLPNKTRTVSVPLAKGNKAKSKSLVVKNALSGKEIIRKKISL